MSMLGGPAAPGMSPGAGPAMPGPLPPTAPAPAPAPPPMLHDVIVVRKKDASQARVEPVPPEEFGISRNARSLRDCDYCFHKVTLSQAKLIAQGYDPEQIKTLPTYTALTNIEEVQRDTVNEFENASGDESNRAARRIEVTEHYIRMDYEGDGKACLYKVVTGGSQGDILKKDGKPDLEEADDIPFAAMTPVIQTHRFFGRSLADLVMDIQRIKTAILRGVLDNVYLANNPRVEVAEQFSGPDTLDDLLVSRPGGIVRTKQPGGLTWQVVPSIAAQAFPVVQYMDAMMESRTGVSRQGQGLDADALQNQSATAVNQVFTAAQAKIKLIARIFAETGIKDLFGLLHETIRKHGQARQTVQLRGKWVPVDPREWKKRDHLTVHVGGTGAHQVANLMMIASAQKEGVAAGLVSRQNLHSTAQQLTKLAGYRSVDQFFVDPSKPPDPQNPAAAPIPPPTDPNALKAQADQAQGQQQVQLTAAKAQADQAHVAAQAQADQQLEMLKFQHAQQLAEREFGLKQAQHQMDMQAKHVDMVKAASTITKPGPAGPDGKPTTQPAIEPEHLLGMLASLHPPQSPHVAPPKMRVVRDQVGRISHLEPQG